MGDALFGIAGKLIAVFKHHFLILGVGQVATRTGGAAVKTG